MPSRPSARITGFSLIELSIVIVIVGLLVGGVIGGKSLIRASELRSISADMARYQSAIVAFSTKYNGLPGDLGNASYYWPTQCVDITGNSCAGDNDGKIMIRQGAPEAKWAVEELRAWQMLSLAGLIEGTYTGVWPVQYKLSVPAARSGLGLYYITYTALADRAGNAIQFSTGLSVAAANTASGGVVVPSDNTGDCYFVAGRPTCSSTAATGGKDESAMIGGSALTTQDAQTLDTKMDDGMPFKGAVRGANGYRNTGALDASCTTASGSDTIYNTIAGTPHCTLTMFLEN